MSIYSIGRPVFNLIGKQFGKLVVISLCKRTKKTLKRKDRLWLCKCSCGKIKKLYGGNLKAKQGTKSCGCITLRTIEQLAMNEIYGAYKRHAKERKYCFNLTKEDILGYLKGECNYCGLSPSNIFRSFGRSYKYSGIDRVNNHKGYTVDNCVSCCKPCNTAKSNLTLKEFFSRIKRIYERHLK